MRRPPHDPSSRPRPAGVRPGTLAVCLVLGLLAAAVAPRAQDRGDAIRGTWSGQWKPDGVYKTASVRFTIDDDAVTGELLNPERLTFDRVEFDDTTLRLVAEARSPEAGAVRVEARVEETTRLNGTLAYGDAAGDLRLTKWTYRPR